MLRSRKSVRRKMRQRLKNSSRRPSVSLVYLGQSMPKTALKKRKRLASLMLLPGRQLMKLTSVVMVHRRKNSRIRILLTSVACPSDARCRLVELSSTFEAM